MIKESILNEHIFNKLSEDDKFEYVFKSLDASFVALRSYYGYKVSLYACENFFIEVYYFPAENQITKIEGIALESKKIDLYIPC